MRFFLILLALLTLTMPVLAQDDDKGYIAKLLEDSLAGDGRSVQINGFAGALSRQATVDSIVIADNDGPWLTMTGLILQLNRTALLRGAVEIEELSAQVIDLTRLPNTPDSELPAAEAQGFSLPELPVSINIKTLRADQLLIGEPILGQRAELSLNASASLIDGELKTLLNAERTDNKRGLFGVNLGFESEGDAITLNITLDEGENGIAALLLALPDNPAVALEIAGVGSLNDLETKISVSTDGEPRLEGNVTLIADAPTAENAAVSRRFRANIGGDVTALFAPQYRPFFGDQIALNIEGQRSNDGALDLSLLDLKTQALALSGAVSLNQDNWPTVLDLKGTIGTADGAPVILPISGTETKVRTANLDIQFDHEKSNAWSADITLVDLDRRDLKVAQTRLNATGILDGDLDAVGHVTANVNLDVSGADLIDPALARAAGEQFNASFKLGFTQGQPLILSDIAFTGADFILNGEAEIGDLESDFETVFDTQLEAKDISRFSDLAGQKLAGNAQISLKGSAGLGGVFDIDLAGSAEDLLTGQEQADQLLKGRTDLSLSAQRNSTGLMIDALDLKNEQLSLEASGVLKSENGDFKLTTTVFETRELIEQLEGAVSVEGTAKLRQDVWSVDVDATGPFGATVSLEGPATGDAVRLSFDAALPDINALVPQYRGSVAFNGVATQVGTNWNVDTRLAGPYGLNAAVEGLVTGPDAKISFEATLPDVKPVVPQYTGAISFNGILEQTTKGWQIGTDLDGPYGLDARVTGRITGDGAPDMAFNARLPNVAPLVPNIAGPLQLDGAVQQSGPDTWQINTDVVGPGGTSARVSGSAKGNGDLDVKVIGDAPLALANAFIKPRSLQGIARFDLGLRGSAALENISGTITTSGARATVPSAGIALNDIAAQIALASGRANIDLNTSISSGGNLAITGPVGLTGQMPANLDITLNNIVIEDIELYKTQLNGALSVDGSLLSNARISGEINVGETQITVPSTGISSFGTIPSITHVGASASVRQSINRAGLEPESTNSSDSGGAAFPLDITVNAPQKIFVRGRGLDAELGGNLRITGTTANIKSSGRFELTRGRLDILQKRFDLDEGIIQLQGSFDPFLRFVATTTTDTGTASVVVEGLASEPEVKFESDPESPQDEVLAQIFFGRDVSQISAIQALQLANAVATLAGRGGDGIVSKLRRGFALDDLDITTDDDGSTAVRAGKYISDNIYTDVTVGTQNNAEVSLNIDLTPNITARGTASNTGNTSLGIFFERDY
ncbi:MAG: translocation/assembly module TamB domain-containing protein [Litoreibacter sp.]